MFVNPICNPTLLNQDYFDMSISQFLWSINCLNKWAATTACAAMAEPFLFSSGYDFVNLFADNGWRIDFFHHFFVDGDNFFLFAGIQEPDGRICGGFIP
jgi:hypothetical protein